MASNHRIIYIEPQAPPKPPEGAVCNGCGLCCLAEPCPLGMVLSRKKVGACHALRWNASDRQYRCGALTEPRGVLQAALPRWTHGTLPALSGLLVRLARRWIAAGAGCDSNLEAQALPSATIKTSSQDAYHDR